LNQSSSIDSYALVTPVRDEAENLVRLAGCVRKQTFLPAAWIIVDNGSADDTVRVAQQLATQTEWISVAAVRGEHVATPGAPIVRAFNRGLELLGRPFDVVVKLDADVSMANDYFERLMEAFEKDESLGIASGSCYELEDGDWRQTHVTGAHVRGASRAYRWDCLQQVVPLEERVGWDGIDALKASIRGWRTATLLELPFYHHRKVGQRDGGPHKRWVAQGRGAYYMGYRFPYLFLRALHRARTNPIALTMIAGYLGPALRREPICSDIEVRAHLRRQQSIRSLPARAREALGRRGT
jgi:poly-beta-1,6-N-acetyl-D-glucosamine synthase